MSEYKHALIVGGAGSIGSVLAYHLLADNYYVDICDPMLFGADSLASFDLQSLTIIEQLFGVTPVNTTKYIPVVFSCFEPIWLENLSNERFKTLCLNLKHCYLNNAVLISEWFYELEPEHRGAILEKIVLDGGGAVCRLGDVFGGAMRIRFDTFINNIIASFLLQEFYSCSDNGSRWLPVTATTKLYEYVMTALHTNKINNCFTAIYRVVELVLYIRNLIASQAKKELAVEFGLNDSMRKFSAPLVESLLSNDEAFNHSLNSLIKNISREEDQTIFSCVSSHPIRFYGECYAYEVLLQKHGSLML